METVKEEEQFLICMRHVDLAKIASERDVYVRRESRDLLSFIVKML